MLLLVADLHLNAQLNGTKTIGGSSPDYATLSDAVSALVSQGINGPVIFNIRPGAYNEQVSIPEITGASLTNTITFQSEDENPDAVVVSYAATGSSDNYVIELDNADYITIRKLTVQSLGTDYGVVILLGFNATNNNIMDNHVIGITNTDYDITSRSVIVSFCNVLGSANKFSNNILEKGYTGINCYSISNTSGTEIINNTFIDQYHQGIYSRWQISPLITGNQIRTNSLDSDFHGIELSYCVDSFMVINNLIEKNSNNGGYGIWVDNCTGSTGMEGLIANNMIHIHSNLFSQTGIYSTKNSFLKIYHNAINLTGTSSGSEAIQFYSDHSNLDVKNNIFNNQSGGYTYNVETTSGLTLDYNDLVTTGPNFGYWTQDIPDLDTWKSTSGQDANSISVDPHFWSNSDLHTANPDLQSGTPLLSDVSQDFDGEARDPSNPCMGADEFVYPALGGTYSIGPAGDYLSFSEAVQALVDGGVRSAVVFNVEDGTYNEQIIIPPIENTSDKNTVFFQSASGNSASVILTYTPAGEKDNYTVRLDEARHLQFRGLTFQSLGTDSAIIFNLINGTGNLVFLNNRFIGSTSETLAYGSLITGEENWMGNNVIVRNNLFINGDKGLVLVGNMMENSSGYVVEHNTFQNQSNNGILIMFGSAPRVTGNEITSNSTGDFSGIAFLYCDSTLVAGKNRIIAPDAKDGYGIALMRYDGGSQNHGIASNNFIHLNAEPTGTIAAGLLVYETDQAKILNNTVILTGDLINSRSVYLMVNYENIDITNNILVNRAGGYTVYADLPSGVVLDYNNLYTNGFFLGLWDGSRYSDLSAWRSASGQDVHSLSVDPEFDNVDDPHFPNPLLNDMGTPLTEVADDIDGEMRDSTHPDIGADEFCLPPTAEDTTGCTTRAIPDLTAIGINVTWYGDGALTNPLSTGNTYATGQTSAGIHTYYVTQTINESESLADTVSLTINTTPGKPDASGASSCFGKYNPDLTADGMNLKWYADEGLATQVGTGSSYSPDDTETGTHQYYVTQTLTGCESDPDVASLTIHPIPQTLLGALFTSCFGEDVPDLTAMGENIKWYSDEILTDHIHSGNEFSPGDTMVGSYLYYFTQTINNCESGPGCDTLRIDPKPTVGITVDVNPIFRGNSTNLNASGADNYLWNPSEGLNQTVGTQVIASPDENTTYIVEGTNEFGCKNYDSVGLSVYCPACATETYFDPVGSFNIGCTNNVYMKNLDCSWTILPSGVGNLYLYFPPEKFDVKTGDWLWVYDGQDNTADTIGRYNNEILPPALIKGGSSLHIRFTTNDNGTGRGFQAEWSNDPSIGIHTLSVDKFMIYPNPAKDNLIIEITGLPQGEIRMFVYNLVGQMVMNRQWNHEGGQIKHELDIGGMESGAYILRIVTSSDIYTGNIMKE